MIAMKNNQKKIWIVDDDAGILEVVQIILSEEGYQVKLINNGDLLQRELQKEIPHLILLDILMSGTDGRDISRVLKKDPKTHAIPIVIMSADMRVDEKAKEAHADGYLKKPFNIEDLLALVQNYVPA